MEQEPSAPHVIVLDRQALSRRGILGLIKDTHPTWTCLEGDTTGLLSTLPRDIDRAVVLVDLSLCGEDLGDLVTRHPNHLFIGLADHDDRLAILDCLSAGARGYVLRSTNANQFLRAIETVADGGVFAPASLTSQPATVPQMVARAPSDATMLQLTDRQRDVFNLLVEGCATKTIARRLDLAVGTVKVHLAAIYRTLGATSRLEAVAKMHRLA